MKERCKRSSFIFMSLSFIYHGTGKHFSNLRLRYHKIASVVCHSGYVCQLKAKNQRLVAVINLSLTDCATDKKKKVK